MSQIADLKRQYMGVDFRQLTGLQLDDIHVKLKSFEPEDLLSVDDHRSYIELLHAFRKEDAERDKNKGENFYSFLSSTLAVGGNSIYSDNLRFIYELIQNVDDVNYLDPSDAKLSVQFDTRKGEIILSYNETGFTPFNVFAITGIAEAAKNVNPDKIEIGEKGIGFKSVFGIADRVLIQSGKFSFELHKDSFTIPWPAYENFEEIQGTRLTLFVTPTKAGEVYRAFADEYCKKDVLFNRNPLLFLNKLSELHLFIDSFRSLRFRVTRYGGEYTQPLTIEENVSIEVDLIDHIDAFDNIIPPMRVVCRRYTTPICYDRLMCQSRYGANTAFTKKKMYMQIVVPNVESVRDENSPIQNGSMYSFLPTRIKLSVPFVCHIPFRLDGSREMVDHQDGNAWFRHSCDSFAKMLKNVYIDLAQHIKEDIILFLPKRGSYLFESDNKKIQYLQQSHFCGDEFLKLPLFYTVDGNYRAAPDVFCFSQREYIPDPIEAYRLLGQSKELFLPKQAVYRNPGLSIVDQVPDKIFNKALLVPEVTARALDWLAKVDNFPFSAKVEKIGNLSFTAEQIRCFANCDLCLSAFNNHSIASIRKGATPEFEVAIDTTACGDIRNIESEGEPFDLIDFDFNSRRYFKAVNFAYLLLDNIPANTFFVSRNVLILPSQSSLAALSVFCSKTDTNSTFAATLTFKECSRELNNADTTLTALEYMSLLRKVRTAIRNGLGKNAYDNYIKLINDSGSDSSRFINELLQNADDCKYEDGVVPSFELTIEKNALMTKYNETGFEKENVRAITAIGESTKKKILDSGHIKNYGEIGEKGVGFKSVFAVVSQVQIFSGDFAFALNDSAPTIPKILTDGTESHDGTKMRFSMKKALPAGFFSLESVLRLCLCLRKLKQIQLGNYQVTIDDDDRYRKININGVTYEYRIVTHLFSVNDEKLIAERTKGQKRVNNIQKVVCYVPVERPLKNYPVYCGLPTTITSNIPLAFDAPFELTTSRDQILRNRWNERIRAEVYNALVKTIHAEKEIAKGTVLKFVKLKSAQGRNTSDVFSDAFLNDYDLVAKLREENFLQTYQKGHFVKPSQAENFTLSRALHYLVYHEEEIGIDRTKIINVNRDVYESQLFSLGVKSSQLRFELSILREFCHKYIGEEKFRKPLYAFLNANADQIRGDGLKQNLKEIPFVPVLSKTQGVTDYIKWSENIYVKDNAVVSPENYYLLDTATLSKASCERILDVHINTADYKIEQNLYLEKVRKRINESTSDATLYEFLIGEFTRNHTMFVTACGDYLRANSELVPLKVENGQIRKGNIFFSSMDAEYFWGEIIPSHIAHKECEQLAIFLKCKNIKSAHFEDLQISEMLTGGDIETLMAPDDFDYGFEIIETCKRRGLISQDLIEYYKLAGLTSVSVDYDEAVLNQPIKDIQKLRQHVREYLINPIHIVKRQVSRTVSYGQRNKLEFPLDSKTLREETLGRYKTDKEYCICQMCKASKHIQFIEVNNIQKEPKYYWPQCGIALCLECSKHFEDLRHNDKIRERFFKGIMDADPMVNRPVEVCIGTDQITFNQTHLAELQLILQGETHIR